MPEEEIIVPGLNDEHWSSPAGCHPECPVCAREAKQEDDDQPEYPFRYIAIYFDVITGEVSYASIDASSEESAKTIALNAAGERTLVDINTDEGFVSLIDNLSSGTPDYTDTEPEETP